MRNITEEIIELIRQTSTDLPVKIEDLLRKGLNKEEKGSAAYSAMESILRNVEMTRLNSSPICQDTGTPLFFVRYPNGWGQKWLQSWIRSAVAEATKKTYLRPNAVNSINGNNTGDNLGDTHFPSIYFEAIDDDLLVIDLLLKGGGCENVGAQYSLPDARLNADRDLEGVRKVVLDAVFKAQGLGCAPGFLGVAIGGDRGSGYLVSKMALLHDLDQPNPNPELDALEKRITKEANELGIGPMGFGGQTTILGTKIQSTYRLPASFFVTISYMCWAYRHRKMIINGDQVIYE